MHLNFKYVNAVFPVHLQEVEVLAAALNQIRNSGALSELMRVGLHVSNFLNFGTGRVGPALKVNMASQLLLMFLPFFFPFIKKKKRTLIRFPAKASKPGEVFAAQGAGGDERCGRRNSRRGRLSAHRWKNVNALRCLDMPAELHRGLARKKQ